MTKKKVAITKEVEDTTPLVKETPYWELCGYTAEEWQGRLHADKIGNSSFELAPYESDFSEFVG